MNKGIGLKTTKSNKIQYTNKNFNVALFKFYP
jgi:hypothetical protein